MHHKGDLLLISVGFFILVSIGILIEANYLFMVFLYYGIPAVYLSVRQPKHIQKSLLYAIMFALPVTLIIDYIGHVSNAWFEPSVIGLRLLNAFPIDAFLWAITFSYYVSIFYEYFFENNLSGRLFSRNTKYFLYVIAVALSVFSIIYFANRAWLVFPHFYFIFIIAFFLLPSIIVLGRHPRLLPKVILQALYFIPYQLIYEVSALHFSNWSFPGSHYIGWVRLFSYQFPFEELLWILLAVPAFICIYEYFVDDLQ